jgi:hypothetical protein
LPIDDTAGAELRTPPRSSQVDQPISADSTRGARAPAPTGRRAAAKSAHGATAPVQPGPPARGATLRPGDGGAARARARRARGQGWLPVRCGSRRRRWPRSGPGPDRGEAWISWDTSTVQRATSKGKLESVTPLRLI